MIESISSVVVLCDIDSGDDMIDDVSVLSLIPLVVDKTFPAGSIFLEYRLSGLVGVLT